MAEIKNAECELIVSCKNCLYDKMCFKKGGSWEGEKQNLKTSFHCSQFEPNAEYLKTHNGDCPFCKDRTLEELPIKSNADLSRTIAMIAQGDQKKEIVLSVKGTAYGVEIDFCPKCGRKL